MQANQLAQAVIERPVMGFYSDLSNALVGLSDDINTLRMKLTPIISEEKLGQPPATATPIPTCSPLASNIWNDTERVRDLRGQVQRLIDDVEI